MKSEEATGLALATLAIEARYATDGSSLALFAKGGDLSLRDMRIAAGSGAPGKDALLAPYDFVGQQRADLDGKRAVDGNFGGPETLVTCPGGAKTKGGAGGDRGSPGMTGAPGPANGGLLPNCTSVDGVAGAPSGKAPGAVSPGKIEATGWVSGVGAKGDDGSPGQGGGGGYGALGAGGAGGGGGGASIAIAVVGTTLTVKTSQLSAKIGGPGGKGAVGQDGQLIYGFGGNRSGGACIGGNGGPGGKGGAGGGGAGGSSLGIAYSGPKPALDSATESATSVWEKAPGGRLAETSPGIEGLSQALFESR